LIRLVRILGILLAAAGVLILLLWLIEPLRFVWPWFLELPWPIRLGLGLAALGLVLLIASLLWERFEDRKQDRSLLDEP